MNRTRGKLRVGGFTPLSTTDYPGELCAVVFCQGCPWRCVYCHNPELIPPQNPAGGLSWERITAFLRRRRGLLDALVFSGGEPTLQRALEAAVAQVKTMGFKVGLHTAGMYPQRLARLLPLLDWVGLDIKALPERYHEIVSVAGSGDAPWRSAAMLAAAGLAHEIRITVDPSLLPVDEVAQILAALRNLGCRNLVLQRRRLESAPQTFGFVDASGYARVLEHTPGVGLR